MQEAHDFRKSSVMFADDEELDFDTADVTFTDEEDLAGTPVMVCDGGAVSVGCLAFWCGNDSCYTTCTCTSIP